MIALWKILGLKTLPGPPITEKQDKPAVPNTKRRRSSEME